MAISPHVARLRALVGHELLLFPSVTVLVEDDEGRTLLVRNAGSTTWSTLGGMVEPEERPADTAVREVEEEANLEVELTELAAVCGGPDCTVVYPNGDRVSYVATVYRARTIGGIPNPDGEEVVELGWFHDHQLAELELDRMARYIFTELSRDTI